MIWKTMTIVLLLAAVSAVHLMYQGSDMGFHILHQQLFFIPLILASFWFGLRTGIIAAIATSLLYGIPMAFGGHASGGHIIIITQSCLYLLVAVLIGWLSDREKRQQRKLFQNERIAALGKAASALSFEVQDIVRRIETIYQREKGSKSGPINDDMVAEIERLKRLLEGLAKFSKPLGDLSVSHDLNELIQKRLPIYERNGAAKGVKVNINLEEGGCPSMVTTEAIPRIIDSLVDNAIDFSERGQSIVLQTKRGGDFCIFEVSDSGPGVSKENEAKLFSAFFTTKNDGYGLALSSGRKALLDLGGDLIYRSKDGGGAIFTMKIPRESPDEKIDE